MSSVCSPETRAFPAYMKPAILSSTDQDKKVRSQAGWPTDIHFLETASKAGHLLSFGPPGPASTSNWVQQHRRPRPSSRAWCRHGALQLCLVPPTRSGARLHQVGHLSTRRPTRTMRPSSALTEQSLQCLARPGRSLTDVCIFLACHAGIFSQFSDRVPASFPQVVAPFFSHTSPSVADDWQCASRRTLPCLTDNHINLLPPISQMPGSVLIGGHCLGLWLPKSPLPLFPPLADAQQCAQWRTLLHHLISLFSFASSRYLAVCSPEDTVFINSHPSRSSQSGSVFSGRRCLHLHFIFGSRHNTTSGSNGCCSWCWTLLHGQDPHRRGNGRAFEVSAALHPFSFPSVR